MVLYKNAQGCQGGIRWIIDFECLNVTEMPTKNSANLNARFPQWPLPSMPTSLNARFPQCPLPWPTPGLQQNIHVPFSVYIIIRQDKIYYECSQCPIMFSSSVHPGECKSRKAQRIYTVSPLLGTFYCLLFY